MSDIGNARITVGNVLFLTDFSEPSEAALPFALAIAEKYGARVHALHVLTPSIPEECREAVEADENLARSEMTRFESKLAGIPHDTSVWHGNLWPSIEKALELWKIDLIVLGTHGRTRALKVLLGSTAEEIFRLSTVPVLTVGPHAQNMALPNGTHSILFPTDFSKPSKAAAPYAVSLAEENEASLILLHVEPDRGNDPETKSTITAMIEQLSEIVSVDARTWCRPVPLVRFGDIGQTILDVASEHRVDLIVLGVRAVAKHMGSAIHLERATAHKIVAHAPCPVLTVRE